MKNKQHGIRVMTENGPKEVISEESRRDTSRMIMHEIGYSIRERKVLKLMVADMLTFNYCMNTDHYLDIIDRELKLK
jgi:hypothetical protein